MAPWQSGITDCSTPLFQRVRNIVEERDRLAGEVERLTKEAVDFGTAWHHAEKMAANEMRCRVANQDAVRHQSDRAEKAEAEVTRLMQAIAVAQLGMSKRDVALQKAEAEVTRLTARWEALKAKVEWECKDVSSSYQQREGFRLLRVAMTDLEAQR